MHDRVYIVVVLYNAEPWLDYFAPAFSNLPEGWKVIVVDNASSDLTVELIRRDYKHFVLIENASNVGFGAANNIGLRVALSESADYVFLLNQDARISVEAIQAMVSVHKKQPNYFILSPVHLSGDGSELDLSFASYCHPRSCPLMYSDALKGLTLQDVYSIERVNAAAWLLSLECLKQIGGFNPSFFHYGEDDEYLQRVEFHKKKVGIVPSQFVEHARKECLFDVNVRQHIKNTFLIDFFCQHSSNSFEKKIFVMCLKSLKSLLTFSPRTAFYIMGAIWELLVARGEIIMNKKQASKLGPSFIY